MWSVQWKVWRDMLGDVWLPARWCEDNPGHKTSPVRAAEGGMVGKNMQEKKGDSGKDWKERSFESRKKRWRIFFYKTFLVQFPSDVVDKQPKKFSSDQQSSV